MTLLRIIFEEVWGLFVDDGSLAAALLAWGLAAGFGLGRLGAPEAWRGPLYFGGFLVVLLANVLWSARRRGLAAKKT